MIYILRRIIVLLAVLFIAVGSVSAAAKQNVYVLVTFKNLPIGALKNSADKDFVRFLNNSAVGLMNNRTAGISNFSNSAATISAGDRSAVSNTKTIDSIFGKNIQDSLISLSKDDYLASGTSVAVSEPFYGYSAIDLYTRYTNEMPPKDAQFLNINIAQLRRVESTFNYGSNIGFLGDMLKENNIDVYTYGNSDFQGTIFRPSFLIAMDSKGAIYGDENILNVQSSIVEDLAYPLGKKINSDFILDSISKNINKKGDKFIIVEYGDFFRLAMENNFYSTESYNTSRDKIRNDFFDFAVGLDHILKQNKKISYKMTLLSLDLDYQNNALLPVVMTSDSIAGNTLLTSSTTKRPGFISNIDITKDILNQFLIKNTASGFAPVAKYTKGVAVSILSKQYNQIKNNYNARAGIIVSFVALAGIAALVLTSLIAFYKNAFRFLVLQEIFKGLAIFLMLFPLGLLLSPLCGIYSLFKILTFAIVFSSGILIILKYILHFDNTKTIFIVCFMTSLCIIIDTSTGCYLAMRSVLSYDSMIGARFYGLGNEYCGILIATTMMFCYILWDKYTSKKWCPWLVGFVFAVVIAVIGHPGLGTNFGGMLAAVAGMGFAFLYSLNLKYDLRFFLWLAFVFIMLTIVTIVINMFMPSGSETHIGRAFEGLMNGDTSMFTDTVIRKVNMNITLMTVSRWIFVLISCLVFLVIILFNPMGVTQKLFQKHRILNAGFCGLIVGLIVGFIFNDSGVVMMATGILYITFALAILCLDLLKIFYHNQTNNN